MYVCMYVCMCVYACLSVFLSLCMYLQAYMASQIGYIVPLSLVTCLDTEELSNPVIFLCLPFLRLNKKDKSKKIHFENS